LRMNIEIPFSKTFFLDSIENKYCERKVKRIYNNLKKILKLNAVYQIKLDVLSYLLYNELASLFRQRAYFFCKKAY